MLNRWVRTTISTLERGGHRVGQTIKTLLRPVRTTAALTSAATLDAFGRARNWWPKTHSCDCRFSCWLGGPRRGRACFGRTASSSCCSPASTPCGATRFISSNPIPSCAGIAYSFTLVWRRRSRGTHRSRGLGAELVELIRTMANANALWGAERIRGELLKLGLRVSKRTIQRYLRACRPRAGRGQTWRTFLRNHAAEIGPATSSNSTTPGSARSSPSSSSGMPVVKSCMSTSPAPRPTPGSPNRCGMLTPYEQAPRFLIRDHDGKFGSHFAAVADGGGHRRGHDPAEFAQRECDLRTLPRLPPPRVPRPHPDPRRGSSSAETGRMGAILQHWPPTPGDRPTHPERAKAARSHGA